MWVFSVLATKARGFVEVRLHSFLISALGASDRSHALAAILRWNGPPLGGEGSGESSRQSEPSGVEDSLLPALGTDPLFRSCLARCVAAVPPELPRLSF
jgi:hypothetical protein